MSTFAIYYKEHVEEDKKIFPSKSIMMSKGHDKICDDILKSKNIKKEIEGLSLICRLYELEISPHHGPILGFVDIFKDEKCNYYSRTILEKSFENNEGLKSDLESDANTLTLNIKPLSFCKPI